jgi:hypothetical protein
MAVAFISTSLSSFPRRRESRVDFGVIGERRGCCVDRFRHLLPPWIPVFTGMTK